ncbi:hypothetical protein [Candidatus Lariskella endosymbiont of Epinotia ramella]|uniref:hypothetical protein n=1 Tax=Candidatus Lariskella endosymbiont of Epinotia ramella TaxID=3066224 RepID=UPI0030D0A3FA
MPGTTNQNGLFEYYGFTKPSHAKLFSIYNNLDDRENAQFLKDIQRNKLAAKKKGVYKFIESPGDFNNYMSKYEQNAAMVFLNQGLFGGPLVAINQIENVGNEAGQGQHDIQSIDTRDLNLSSLKVDLVLENTFLSDIDNAFSVGIKATIMDARYFGEIKSAQKASEETIWNQVKEVVLGKNWVERQNKNELIEKVGLFDLQYLFRFSDSSEDVFIKLTSKGQKNAEGYIISREKLAELGNIFVRDGEVSQNNILLMDAEFFDTSQSKALDTSRIEVVEKLLAEHVAISNHRKALEAGFSNYATYKNTIQIVETSKTALYLIDNANVIFWTIEKTADIVFDQNIQWLTTQFQPLASDAYLPISITLATAQYKLAEPFAHTIANTVGHLVKHSASFNDIENGFTKCLISSGISTLGGILSFGFIGGLYSGGISIAECTAAALGMHTLSDIFTTLNIINGIYYGNNAMKVVEVMKLMYSISNSEDTGKQLAYYASTQTSHNTKKAGAAIEQNIVEPDIKQQYNVHTGTQDEHLNSCTKAYAEDAQYADQHDCLVPF